MCGSITTLPDVVAQQSALGERLGCCLEYVKKC